MQVDTYNIKASNYILCKYQLFGEALILGKVEGKKGKCMISSKKDELKDHQGLLGRNNDLMDNLNIDRLI